MHRAFFAAWALVGAIALPAWGQPVGNPQAQELRRQIEALQEQLERLERERPRDQRVTRIGEARPRARAPRLTLRVYDLGDLFASVPSYAALYASDLTDDVRPLFRAASGAYDTATPRGLGGMGMGGGFFGVTDPPPGRRGPPPDVLRQHEGAGADVAGGQTSLDELIQAIQSTISPESWEPMGGEGSIAKLGNALLISADEETHDRIDDLLNLFRERWGTLRTVSVQAWWLWLDDEALEHLLADPEDEAARVEGVRAFGLVDEAAWKEHLRQLRDPDNGKERGYRAAITCYNGQTVHALSGGQRLAVTRVQPVVARSFDDDLPVGPVAYRPVVSLLQEGAALQLTPVANVAGRTVLLDVHSRVVHRQDAPNADPAEPSRDEDHASPHSPRAVTAALDRVALTTHQLSTTLRVPVERTLLVGGMTFGGNAEEGDLSLYLFVRATVQELRNDREERQAEVNLAPQQAAPPEADFEAPPDEIDIEF